MQIIIVLRTSGTTSVFRDAIIDALGSKHIDEALLCSGFFQENFKGSKYQVTKEGNFAAKCALSKIRLTTVGIHNTTWKKAYFDFRDHMVLAGANITCLYKPNMRWHAKIFIASQKGEPVFGIVGSSNMTRNAFSSGGKFNNECDVFIWEKDSAIAILAEEISSRLDGQIVVRATYDPSLNGGLTVAQILTNISSEVLGSGLREL